MMVLSLLATNDHANPLDPLYKTCRKSCHVIKTGIDGDAQHTQAQVWCLTFQWNQDKAHTNGKECVLRSTLLSKYYVLMDVLLDINLKKKQKQYH